MLAHHMGEEYLLYAVAGGAGLVPTTVYLVRARAGELMRRIRRVGRVRRVRRVTTVR
jgi:hypothetical protein